jgi:hypothetical protein
MKNNQIEKCYNLNNEINNMKHSNEFIELKNFFNDVKNNKSFVDNKMKLGNLDL